MTHLIIGGPGRSGSRILDRLHRLGQETSSASRRTGFDWHDRSTWAPFLADAQTAYVTYSPDLAFPGVADLLGGLGEAGRIAGIERFVLLSGRGEEGARASETALMAAGVPVTVLRCSWFQQNFSENFLLGPVRRGRLRLPARDVGEAFVDLDDIADAAVLALTRPEPLREVFELSGPELLTFGDVARILSAEIGRTVTFEAVTVEEFVADLSHDGLGREEAEPLGHLFTEILDGRNSALVDGVQRLLGRSPASFGAYAARTARTGVWA